jgi:hypothetical protein
LGFNSASETGNLTFRDLNDRMLPRDILPAKEKRANEKAAKPIKNTQVLYSIFLHQKIILF